MQKLQLDFLMFTVNTDIKESSIESGIVRVRGIVMGSEMEQPLPY